MNPETILTALYDLWAKENGEQIEIQIYGRGTDDNSNMEA